jgi:hypothetical protein
LLIELTLTVLLLLPQVNGLRMVGLLSGPGNSLYELGHADL